MAKASLSNRANIWKLASKQEARALSAYNVHYNNFLYSEATEGKSVRRANALIDEALALSGSPYYTVTNTKWSEAEIRFLEQFV